MRALFVCLFMAAVPALACSEDVLTLNKWTVKRSSDVTFRLKMELIPAFRAPVRMVDAQVYFSDRLGGQIGGAILDRDTKIDDALFTEVIEFGTGLRVARLLDVDPADVVTRVCTKAVIYDDGTKQTFD